MWKTNSADLFYFKSPTCAGVFVNRLELVCVGVSMRTCVVQ